MFMFELSCSQNKTQNLHSVLWNKVCLSLSEQLLCVVYVPITIEMDKKLLVISCWDILINYSAVSWSQTLNRKCPRHEPEKGGSDLQDEWVFLCQVDRCEMSPVDAHANGRCRSFPSQISVT